MIARLLALALLPVMFGHRVKAQEWSVFDMDNSPIPSTTVKALVADGGGGLWVGTDWGLCRFDGHSTWTIFQEANSPLVENDIRCLALDHQGRLWIGTESMGLQLKDGDAWETYVPTNSPLPEYDIRDLFIAPDGAVWICTAGGLARFDGTDWIIYDDTPESHDGAILNTANTNAVAVRADGTILMGSFNGGLHIIQGSDVEVLTSFDDNFFDNTAVDVAFHPTTGERWVATPAAGLLRQQGPLVGGLWTQWYGGVGFPTNATTSMTIDGEGDVWVGSHIAGVIRVKADGTYQQFTQENSGLPDNTIRSVLATDNGVLWVGTFSGGLARYIPMAGLEEAGRSSSHIHPNPTSDRFVVRIPHGEGRSYWTLFQTNGALVKAGSDPGDQLVVEVQDLPIGTYLFELRRDGSIERMPVFVVR